MEEEKEVRQWVRILWMLFQYRFEAPFTARELYDDYILEWDAIGVKNYNSLKCALKSTIPSMVYKLRIPKDAPPWKPNYYAINVAGVDALVRKGFIKKKDKSLYQEEVKNLRESLST